MILNLTNYTGPRPSVWPDDMPDKITLVRGRHTYLYDVSSVHYKEAWYRKLVKNLQQKEPYKSDKLPIGLSIFTLDEIKKFGAVIEDNSNDIKRQKAPTDDESAGAGD